MNTRIIKIFVSASLFVMLAALVANAQDLRLKANIPFDFMYGDVTIPAGEYDLANINLNIPVFRIGDVDGKNVALRTAMKVTRAKVPSETVLVFNRYRDNGGEVSHFLAQVWTEGSNTGFEFFKHHAEREAAKRAATRDIITIVVKRVTSMSE